VEEGLRKLKNQQGVMQYRREGISQWGRGGIFTPLPANIYICLNICQSREGYARTNVPWTGLDLGAIVSRTWNLG